VGYNGLPGPGSRRASDNTPYYNPTGRPLDRFGNVVEVVDPGGAYHLPQVGLW
jgi:hypothetical protein